MCEIVFVFVFVKSVVKEGGREAKSHHKSYGWLASKFV